MKCQYQAVISTTIRCASTGLCRREALAAQIKAIIPPARCTACAIVSRNTNELFGFVSTKNPRACNSPQANHCPARNAIPSRTVIPSHGKDFSSPTETPGIDFTGASAACSAAFRRANSMVTLLTSNTAVLIANSSHGKSTRPQSRTYVFDAPSNVGSPCRTIYALVSEMNTMRSEEHTSELQSLRH